MADKENGGSHNISSPIMRVWLCSCTSSISDFQQGVYPCDRCFSSGSASCWFCSPAAPRWRTITITDPRSGVEYTVDRQIQLLTRHWGPCQSLCRGSRADHPASGRVEGFTMIRGITVVAPHFPLAGVWIFSISELNVKRIFVYRALPEKGVWKVYKADKSDPL